MRCPNVQRCEVCEQLLVHKGSRSRHESSSYFGQIVHNLLPQTFTWADIDGAIYRRTLRLLRIFEHKAPGQHRKYPQRELLTLLGRLIEHAKTCTVAAAEFGLHRRSGAFLIEGDPHEGNQLGECKITRLTDGEFWIPPDELAALRWIALLEGSDVDYVREKLARRRRQPVKGGDPCS